MLNRSLALVLAGLLVGACAGADAPVKRRTTPGDDSADEASDDEDTAPRKTSKKKAKKVAASDDDEESDDDEGGVEEVEMSAKDREREKRRARDRAKLRREMHDDGSRRGKTGVFGEPTDSEDDEDDAEPVKKKSKKKTASRDDDDEAPKKKTKKAAPRDDEDDDDANSTRDADDDDASDPEAERKQEEAERKKREAARKKQEALVEQQEAAERKKQEAAEARKEAAERKKEEAERKKQEAAAARKEAAERKQAEADAKKAEAAAKKEAAAAKKEAAAKKKQEEAEAKKEAAAKKKAAESDEDESDEDEESDDSDDRSKHASNDDADEDEGDDDGSERKNADAKKAATKAAAERKKQELADAKQAAADKKKADADAKKAAAERKKQELADADKADAATDDEQSAGAADDVDDQPLDLDRIEAEDPLAQKKVAAVSLDGSSSDDVDSATDTPATPALVSLTDRALTHKKRGADVHAGMRIAKITFPGTMDTPSLSKTSEAFVLGGSYGLTDKLEVGGDYALSVNPGTVKGPLTLRAAYSLAHGKLDVALAGALAVDFYETTNNVTMTSTTTTYESLQLGAWVRYHATPKLSLFTGSPALPNAPIGISTLAYPLPPFQYQVAVGLNAGGPITLEVPAGVSFQVTPALFAFGALNIANISLKNSQNVYAFRDFIPVSVGAFYSLRKADVGFQGGADLEQGLDYLRVDLVLRYYVK